MDPSIPSHPADNITIEPASQNDASQMADVYMNAFDVPDFHAMWPQDGSGWRHVKGYLDRALKPHEDGDEPKQESKFLVIKEDGVVRSVALFWAVRPEDRGFWAWRTRWPAPLPGQDAEAMEDFFQGLQTQHHKVMGEREHVYLEIIMTHADYRRRGYATALLKRGAEIANDMGYDAYLDAEEDASRLYQRAGYVYQQEAHTPGALMPMLCKHKPEGASR